MSDTPARSTPKLEDLVDFPTVFVFRAVGRAEADFEVRCSAAVTATLGRMPDSVDTRPSAGGRWISVRLAARVHTPDEVYAVYAALRAVDGVHMVL